MKKAKSTKSPVNSASTEPVVAIIYELLTIKDKLGKLGAWRGYHALDKAIGDIGWEAAGRED